MSVLIFIGVLIVLILIHEFGHFFAAKFFGVKVEEFGIGYPPKVMRLFKIGETEYTLNWLPFGGFVKLLGENSSDKEKQDTEYKQRSLEYKHPAKQIAVLFAGVFMNFIFAWVLFSYVFFSGVPLFWDKNYLDNSKLVVNDTLQNSPAQIAGLQEGDTIKEVYLKSNPDDKVNTLSPDFVALFISKHPGEEIVIQYFDKSENRTDDTVLVPTQGIIRENPATPAVGISMTLVSKERVGLAESAILGFKTSVDVLKDVTLGIFKLATDSFTGNADLKNIAGPVGIAGMVSSAASVGFAYLLYFTAIISVNLSVINLIPIPALDGGRILFVFIEWISRKKIPPAFFGVLNFVGFALLIILMLLVTYNDIARLIN